tara:strand:- start:46 stop:909 length:864 start_codon:yes stop_codon:yes gene_type:complete
MKIKPFVLKVKKLKAFNKPKSEPYKAPLKYDAKFKSIIINKNKELSLTSSIAKQDKAARVASHIEHRTLREGLKRIRAKNISIFGTSGYKVKKTGTNFSIKTPKAKKAIKSFNKAATKVTIIARKKGEKAYEAASKKLGVGRRFYGVRKPKQGFMDAHERKITGQAPAILSESMKDFYAGQRPSALLKKHRGTLSKIYQNPKSWKQRAPLIRHYKNVAKSELKQAKIDRDIFRDSTVQKITGEKTFWRKGGYVSKPRKVSIPITKTVMQPEKTYDVTTKRWKRTKPI